MRAEFCIFESNAPGLKVNFCEPYVDMPSGNAHWHHTLGSKNHFVAQCNFCLRSNAVVLGTPSATANLSLEFEITAA